MLCIMFHLEMSRVVKETKEAIKGTVKVGKSLESKRKKDKVTGTLQQQFDQLQLVNKLLLLSLLLLLLLLLLLFLGC